MLSLPSPCPAGAVRASSIFPILSVGLLFFGGLCVAASEFYKSKHNVILSAGIFFVSAGRSCLAGSGAGSSPSVLEAWEDLGEPGMGCGTSMCFVSSLVPWVNPHCRENPAEVSDAWSRSCTAL